MEVKGRCSKTSKNQHGPSTCCEHAYSPRYRGIVIISKNTTSCLDVVTQHDYASKMTKMFHSVVNVSNLWCVRGWMCSVSPYQFRWTCETARVAQVPSNLLNTQKGKASIMLSYIVILDESGTLPKKCSIPLKVCILGRLGSSVGKLILCIWSILFVVNLNYAH